MAEGHRASVAGERRCPGSRQRHEPVGDAATKLLRLRARRPAPLWPARWRRPPRPEPRPPLEPLGQPVGRRARTDARDTGHAQRLGQRRRTPARPPRQSPLRRPRAAPPYVEEQPPGRAVTPPGRRGRHDQGEQRLRRSDPGDRGRRGQPVGDRADNRPSCRCRPASLTAVSILPSARSSAASPGPLGHDQVDPGGDAVLDAAPAPWR